MKSFALSRDLCRRKSIEDRGEMLAGNPFNHISTGGAYSGRRGFIPAYLGGIRLNARFNFDWQRKSVPCLIGE